jgi:hypothetical protein
MAKAIIVSLPRMAKVVVPAKATAKVAAVASLLPAGALVALGSLALMAAPGRVLRRALIFL